MWCYRSGHRKRSQQKQIGMNCGLFGVLAAGHSAGIHLAHIMAAMAAVQRSVVAILRGMMMPVDGALTCGAASAGTGHPCCHGKRHLHQE